MNSFSKITVYSMLCASLWYHTNLEGSTNSQTLPYPPLLESLQSIDPRKPMAPSLSALWEVHQEWILPLIAFVLSKQNHDIDYPQDLSHPVYFFDRQDAQEILRPIFKNVAQMDLTDDLIQRVFFDQVPYGKSSQKLSSVVFFKRDSVKREVFKIAELVYKYVKGQTLILLGQTPAYVGEMVAVIDELSKGGTSILQVPFSGRPDYTSKLRYKRLWPLAYLDIVTPAGRDRFISLLEQRGLTPKNAELCRSTIFILDNSSGASVACFLAILKKWFESVEAKCPDIIFLEMCGSSDFTILNENGKWERSDHPDLSAGGSLRFETPTVFLGMQDAVLNAFDKLDDNLRIVPPFNGIHWSKEYLESSLRLYPTPEANELIREYQDYAWKEASSSIWID